MSEPSEAVYEAAYQAFKCAPLGSSIVRAVVDFAWPLAVAEGRRQAAEAILAKGREFHPATLRAQLLEAAARIAEGAENA